MDEDGGCRRASIARHMQLERMQKFKAKRDRHSSGAGVLGVRRGCGFFEAFVLCFMFVFTLFVSPLN